MDIFVLLLMISISTTVLGVLLLVIDLITKNRPIKDGGTGTAYSLSPTPALAPIVITAPAPVVTPAVSNNNFLITRRKIAEDFKNVGNPDIKILERPENPQLPMTLKYKGKTFALLHGTDSGVLMIARLAEDYATELIYKHPALAIRRATFPKGPNWYSVPVEGVFRDKDSVYDVLTNALAFVVSGGNQKAS